MTEKAQRILNKLNSKRRKESKPWSIMTTDKTVRDKLLNDFNQSTLDPVGPVGGQKGEKFLAELNELQQFENDNWGRGSV